MNSVDLSNRLIEFSVDVIKMTRSLPKEFCFKHLSTQIIRSSTSSALNYGEAISGESKRDFIHKMRITLKELRETHINLKILNKLHLQTNHILMSECDELISIFVSSIKTASN